MSLSVAAGFGLLALKFVAYVQTSSSAILSDAAESIVHIVAVCFAAYSLRLSAKPADADHQFGHSKIDFISAGFEGAMVAAAGLIIAYHSVAEWINGIRVVNLDLGIAYTAGALAVNLLVGGHILRMGKRSGSLILMANGKHVLADAWTSLGAIVGLALALWTGWKAFDPICALIVAGNLIVSGGRLMNRSGHGLMDTADPAVGKALNESLEKAEADLGVGFHHLRHHETGAGHRIEMHLTFPDEMSIRRAHELATIIENRLRDQIDLRCQITTHLEPARDHGRLHGA